jgi:hypothetical protein
VPAGIQHENPVAKPAVDPRRAHGNDQATRLRLCGLGSFGVSTIVPTIAAAPPAIANERPDLVNLILGLSTGCAQRSAPRYRG